MSAKWRRSQQWDNDNLRGPMLWPVKFVLRALSSITLAVTLLTIVVIYGTLASVPIGMIALIPTKLVYLLTILLAMALVMVPPIWVLSKVWKNPPQRRSLARFSTLTLGGIALCALGAVLWYRYAWPALHYDPAYGTGVRFFGDFADAYKATTLRRLPGLEMSELQFYDWWPLRLILLLFIANMITATVRRIEFTIQNLGVLTVHTGIVVIALGSIYYNGAKQEGDTILLSGGVNEEGKPQIGPPQIGFYDNTDVALFLNAGDRWQQRPLHDLPRYNDYNLKAITGRTVREATRMRPLPGDDRGRTLDIPIPEAPGTSIDPDLSFRVIGYASYAEPAEDWVEADPLAAFGATNPLRVVNLLSGLPDTTGNIPTAPVFSFHFLPKTPAERIAESAAVMAIEYTMGMSDQRWLDLATLLPENTPHALVVELPGVNEDGKPWKRVFPVTAGMNLKLGETGYTVSVKELLREPPFPIITRGYENASSSLAVVRITTPDGTGYDRWVYHRFPEISQDMLDEVSDVGMPSRRDADPAVRVSYIDATQLQVYFDEREDGSVRSLVRQPGGAVRVVESIPAGGTFEDVVPKISLVLGERWPHARKVERPAIVPDSARDRRDLGNHQKAMIALEISGRAAVPGSSARTGQAWTTVVWLPFTKYLDVGMGTERMVEMPDGRMLKMAFGRRWHPLPGFQIQLVDFQMLAYDHRGAPRDYQSLIRVTPTGMGGHETFRAFEHVTKLNAPLQAPFLWDDESRSYAGNILGTLASRLNPNQFKFSQAGWDQQGWNASQERVDQGLAKRPTVTFTILGVGNNPGIHIVAFGGVLMGLGIPWAFYIKPWLVQREKKRIQAAIAAGEYPGVKKNQIGRGKAEPLGVNA